MRFSKSGLVSVLAAAAWLLSAVYLVVDGRRSHVVHASGILALPATVVQTNQSNTYTTGTQNFAAAVHTIPTIVVASTGALPASGCTNGELAVVTSATPGQQIYENSSTGSCTWTQQTGGGGGSGGGVITYSGAALTTVTGTIFCPAGGGGTCSGTEANVDLASSSAATITNLSVQLSTALGAGNTVTVTWRKNGASQSSACSISGAVATSCQDTTHSFNVSQGDLVDYQLVFSGTILVNPFLSVMSQFGTTTTSGSVNSGTSGQLGYYAATGSAISGGPSAHNIGVPLQCVAASASGTAYTCSTTPSFTPGAGDEILFKADVPSGASPTLNVNSSSAQAVDKQGCGTALVANDFLAGQWVDLINTGSVWCMQGQTGNASSGSAGSFVILASQTATNVSPEVDFPSIITSTYDIYEIDVLGLLGASSTDFLLQMSTNNGVSYDTGNNYSYTRFISITGSGGANDSNGTTNGIFFSPGSPQGTASNQGVDATLRLYNPLASGSTNHRIAGFSSGVVSSVYRGANVQGAYVSTTAVTAFRIITGTGNLASGTVRVYGISH